MSEEDPQTRIKKCFIGNHSEKLKPFILLQEFFLTPENSRNSFVDNIVTAVQSIEITYDIVATLKVFLEILNKVDKNLLTEQQQSQIRQIIQTRQRQTLDALIKVNNEALNLRETNQQQTITAG